MPMASEEGAIARLQEIAILAAQAMAPSEDPRFADLPPRMTVMLVCTRSSLPRGERFKLISNMKSPLGEFMSCKERDDGRFDCLGRFPAVDVLAFCMAKLEQLGGHCPVVVRGPEDHPNV